MKYNKCKNNCKTGTTYTKGGNVTFVVKCKKVEIKQGTHVHISETKRKR